MCPIAPNRYKKREGDEISGPQKRPITTTKNHSLSLRETTGDPARSWSKWENSHSLGSVKKRSFTHISFIPPAAMSAAMRASQFSLSLVGRGARVHQRALEAPSQMRPKMEAMRLFHVPPETGQHHSSHHIIIITKLKCVHLFFFFFFFSLVLHLWEEGKPTKTTIE